MSEEETNECRSIEDVLHLTGSKGRFQLLLFLSMSVLILPATFAENIVPYLLRDSPWRCANNSSTCRWNGTMPAYDRSMCGIPETEWYFTEPDNYSITTQFRLSCVNNWVLYSVYFMILIGKIVDSLIMGWFADKYGRKPIVFLSVAGVIITVAVASFSPNIYALCIFLFITGLFTSAAMGLPFVLFNELTSKQYRLRFFNLLFAVVSLARCFQCLKAYLINRWNLLMIACSVPYILVISSMLFVPESFMWLHVKQNEKELKKLVLKISIWNKKMVPANISVKPVIDSGEEKESDFFDIFRSTWKTTVQALAWTVAIVIYALLTEVGNNISESICISTCIASLVDIPAYLVAAYSGEKLGRRLTTMIGSVMSTACVIILGFIAVKHPVFIIYACRMATALIGRFFNTITRSTLLYWSLELYPTNVRGQAHGVFLMTISFTVPFFYFLQLEIQKLYGGAPFFISGIVSFIICGFIKLQENTTSTTMEDGEFE